MSIPLPGLEPVAAEQAAHPPERALRYLAALADDGTVRGTADARERCTGHRVEHASYRQAGGHWFEPSTAHLI